jgi:cellulose synthase/poly-beta-1,6-N-acetylglucosamine synthase-like glycosyltransferase
LVLVTILYAFISLWLALYSFNGLYLLWLYHRKKANRSSPPIPEIWPTVTVQLPVYNEAASITRLLTAVSILDYPKHQLEIQILDDSTDETTTIVQDFITNHQPDGIRISHNHRQHRTGYKAGALAEGVTNAKGEFLAVFDADFIPPPNFLKQVMPWFVDDNLGCIQTRWGHLNRNDSILTQLQALAIDAHFMVEQTARSRNGYLMSFNGSAGVWRKTCIQDAGGWQAETLTEDFDLSYRAQLKGWSLDYLPDVVVPAELPPVISVYKTQQKRWARGSIQTARKLLKPLLQSGLKGWVKFEGVLHLTHYLVHPLVLILLLLSVWMRFTLTETLQWLPWLTLTAIGPPLLYLTAAAPEAPDWKRRLKLIPALLVFSIGISLNNALAVFVGLFGPMEGEFIRTPKFTGQNQLITQRSKQNLNAIVWTELALAVFAFSCMLLAMINQNWGFVPWMFMYTTGYGSVAIMSLWPNKKTSFH